ncbi:response regulator, partial [Pseudonocardia oceani]
MIRVMVVDDHPVVRDGLRGVLDAEPDMEVVGEAGHGAEALARVAAAAPDVVLMDLRMPVMGGVDAIRELRRAAPAVRVLVLTTFDTDRDVLPAVEAGATGYLLKDTPRDELLRAVRAAHRGEAVLSPAVAGRLMGQVRGVGRGDGTADALSAREMEVLRFVAAGSTN